MSKKSIFSRPHLKKDVNRSAFDISQKRVFHTPFGMLLPCFYKRVPANSYVEIQPESQFICDSITRPAFIRLKEHINYYAVPYSQLWHPFDNIITSQDSFDSSAVEYFNSDSTYGHGKIPPKVPTFGSQLLEKVAELLSSEADVHGYNELLNTVRLLNLLNYGNFYGIVNENRTDDIPQPLPIVPIPPTFDSDFSGKFDGFEESNFFGLLAYQKVYYDYYRNPNYERCITRAYNIDDLAPSEQQTDAMRFLDCFRVHYAWAKKDYFTNVTPSILPTTNDIGFLGMANAVPTAGLWSLFGVPGASGNGQITAISPVAGVSTTNNNNVGDAVFNIPTTQAQSFPSETNVSALRFAFAYDKLLRRMREAGGTFDKQMLAQFGITPYDQRNGKCHFIGGQTNRLSASDITQVSGDGLGQLGSQINAYSSPRGTFKYKANEDCVIIGVYHTSLDFDYTSCNNCRENMSKYRFDWFNPQFQNLGKQPIHAEELINLYFNQESSVTPGQTDLYDSRKLATVEENRKLLGFTNRYADYKTNVDKVYGLFDPYIRNVEFSSWVAPNTTQYFGVYTHDWYVAPLTQRQLTFNPAQFNSVVKTVYNGDWINDPFKNHLYTHCKLIANMSVDGEVY